MIGSRRNHREVDVAMIRAKQVAVLLHIMESEISQGNADHFAPTLLNEQDIRKHAVNAFADTDDRFFRDLSMHTVVNVLGITISRNIPVPLITAAVKDTLNNVAKDMDIDDKDVWPIYRDAVRNIVNWCKSNKGTN